MHIIEYPKKKGACVSMLTPNVSALVEATACDLLTSTAGPYAKEIFAPLRKDILQQAFAIQRELGKSVLTREDVGLAIGRALRSRIAS